MQAVHMPYRPKYSLRKKPDDIVVGSSPLVRLKSVNTFSERPVYGSVTKAVAYSRGKLSAMPDVGWDSEEGL